MQRRMSRLGGIAILIVFAFLAVVVSGDGSAAAGTPEADDPIESTRETWTDRHTERGFDDHVSYHRHFRSQFDFLDESDATIAGVMGAPATNDSFAQWGLEMSDAEYEEMDRRDRIQREFPAIAAAAVGESWSEELLEGLEPNKSFGAFAGRWIDQKDGGKLKVALVPTHPDYDSARERAQDVKDALVAEDKLAASDVVFVDVVFTADEIYRVNREFGEIYLSGKTRDRQAIGMSASMNPVDNRVDLYAEPAWVKEAASFADQYPKGLVTIVEAPAGGLQITDTGWWPPRDDWGAGNWHAGAGIVVVDGTGYAHGACAWGATARTTSYVYLVTAAHCLGEAYADNDIGATGWWNAYVGANSQRGVHTWSGNDWITDLPAGFVYVYHGVRGDLARLMITEASNVNDYDCYLEDEDLCGQNITRRETISETEIGDTKCLAMHTNGYVCATLNSNDAPISGYDYLRGIDTNSGNRVDKGDSGAGVHEHTLMTGIIKGRTGWWGYDSYFTHAYYIEASGYLAATTVCGTSGVCNN